VLSYCRAKVTGFDSDIFSTDILDFVSRHLHRNIGFCEPSERRAREQRARVPSESAERERRARAPSESEGSAIIAALGSPARSRALPGLLSALQNRILGGKRNRAGRDSAALIWLLPLCHSNRPNIVTKHFSNTK
jgi:hypothetical protein